MWMTIVFTSRPESSIIALVCPVPEISISFVAIKMGRRQGARRAHIQSDT